MSNSIAVTPFSWLDLVRALNFFLGNLRRKYLLLTLVIFAVYFEFLVPPYLIGRIVDFFSKLNPGESLSPFYWTAALLATVSVSASIIRLSCKSALGGVGIQVEYQARVKGFERLMDLSLAWHDQENTGNKVQKIQTGSSALAELIRILYATVLPTTAQFVGVLSVFLWLKPSFLLFCLLYLSIYFYLNYYFYGREQEASLRLNRALEAASGTYFEGTNNILTIQALGAKDSVVNRVLQKETLTKSYRLAIRDLGILQWKAYQVVNAAGMFIFLLLVGQSVLSSLITVGAVFTYFSYFTSLTLSAGEFVNFFGRLIELKVAVGRMMPIFWDRQNQEIGQAEFPSDWQTLTIDSGNFRYRQAENEVQVRDLNLIIRRLDKIGIAGSSGSGKSTLAKLLLGIYRLESGVMTIDQTEYSKIRSSAITDNVSIVLQESEFFNLSLRDNITLQREIAPELFARALEIAQLGPVIDNLPEGLDTLIGEKGCRLSGGERQRAGIARAICKDPSILVLDEATSALDNHTEQLVHSALMRELSGKTLVIIAHRLSTLEKVDRIYVFDRGTIVESGSFADLMANQKSFFRRLMQQSEAGS